MAETHNGEAYYDAGTINEQLDDYEVYEVDGRLYLNKEGADPEEYVSFDGISQFLQNARNAHPTASELADEEFIIYGYDPADDGQDVDLYAAYNNGGSSVVTISLAAFVSGGVEQ